MLGLTRITHVTFEVIISLYYASNTCQRYCDVQGLKKIVNHEVADNNHVKMVPAARNTTHLRVRCHGHNRKKAHIEKRVYTRVDIVTAWQKQAENNEI